MVKTKKQMEQDLLDRMNFEQCIKFNEWIVKKTEVKQKNE